jgi:hypothetical protein
MIGPLRTAWLYGRFDGVGIELCTCATLMAGIR